MPIYEYQCQACGEEIEALQKMSDAPLVDCPACNQPALKKKISAVAFRLKGSGWYETDFKDGGKKNLAGDGANSSDANGENKSGESAKADGAVSGQESSTGSSGTDSGGSAGKSGDKASTKAGGDSKSPTSSKTPDSKDSSGS